MIKPDATEYNPDPEYFGQLVESTGLPVPELATLVGHHERTIRRWMRGERRYPYSMQYILEALVLMP